MKKLNLEKIKSKIIELRGQKVIIDSDVATLYGVKTRDINKAVKNNPDKFPDDYIFELNKAELEDLRCKFSTAKFSKTRVLPKSFTEKGLYMIATILKSPMATYTTIAIIETFAKIRELSRNINALTVVQDKQQKQNLLQKSGEIIRNLFNDNLSPSEKKTTIELNLAVLKVKHSIKKTKK
ncbi:MAG: ORF6N domain-containing protein [Elusimicrobia bacterium]|nr:ORF6N domain-containing protein [Elusimicrobiota bacterium]